MENIPSSNSTIRWVKESFRRVKNCHYYLDTHDYGREYWYFPVRTRKNYFEKPPFGVVFLYQIQMVV